MATIKVRGKPQKVKTAAQRRPSYFKGHGKQVWADFLARYGSDQGKRYFYATVNRMRHGTKAQRAVQPKLPPGTKRR